MLSNHSDQPRFSLTVPRESGRPIVLRFENSYELAYRATNGNEATCDEIVSALLNSPICVEVLGNNLALDSFIIDLHLANKKSSISLILAWLTTNEVYNILKTILFHHPLYNKLTLENVNVLITIIFNYITPYELNRTLNNYLDSSPLDIEATSFFCGMFLKQVLNFSDDILITVMPNLLNNPRLFKTFLHPHINMETWESFARRMPDYTSNLCAHYREMTTAEGKKITSLLARAESEGLDTTTWLLAGDHPDEALRILVERPHAIQAYQNGEHIESLEKRIRYLEYGADPTLDPDLIVHICAVNDDLAAWRNHALHRSLAFYHPLLSGHLTVFPQLLRPICEAFPNSKKYVDERGVGTVILSRAEDWRKVSSKCNADEFASYLKTDSQIARNIYLNICIYLSQQDRLPSRLNFDVLFLLMQWMGLDPSTRNASRALLVACQEQKALIKEMSQSPGGINVCQSRLANGELKFTFFKSFSTYEKDQWLLVSKLKKNQKRSFKEIIFGHEFSADSNQQLASFQAGVERVVESQRSASGPIQKRILQSHLNRSPLYQNAKHTNELMDELMDDFVDLAPKQWQ